jgi:hypothetical protein
MPALRIMTLALTALALASCASTARVVIRLLGSRRGPDVARSRSRRRTLSCPTEPDVRTRALDRSYGSC